MKRKIIITGLLALSCLLLNFRAQSQTLLTPGQLTGIHQQKDNDRITRDLSGRGYLKTNFWETKKNGEAETTWTFQTRGGETVDFEIRKLTWPSGKAKTLYWIFNVYNYKAFMSSLAKAQYLFSEVKVIDNLAYLAFKKADRTLLIIERRPADSKGAEGVYYEIRLD